ncbi:hypothetical protein C8J57DRAFT_1212126 [Mycena rebaudengoi]|nr:hypothetical protein C8J57DRAFT_1212126 [Mycena rebaudengoi]
MLQRAGARRLDILRVRRVSTEANPNVCPCTPNPLDAVLGTQVTPTPPASLPAVCASTDTPPGYPPDARRLSVTRHYAARAWGPLGRGHAAVCECERGVTGRTRWTSAVVTCTKAGATSDTQSDSSPTTEDAPLSPKHVQSTRSADDTAPSPRHPRNAHPHAPAALGRHRTWVWCIGAPFEYARILSSHSNFGIIEQQKKLTSIGDRWFLPTLRSVAASRRPAQIGRNKAWPLAMPSNISSVALGQSKYSAEL